MVRIGRCLYTFIGIHSFLLGLFPFYIPVYLYSRNNSLSQISAFIAITGVGFCVCLFLWDRVHKKISLRYLIVFSYLAEFAVLSLFFIDNNLAFLFLAGFFNGLFNGSFWVTQRLLFLETITPQNSGEKFGNFQIYVVIILKIGVFIGGLMLEKSGFFSLYMVSAVIIIAASVLFLHKGLRLELNAEIRPASPLQLKKIISFKDGYHSRTIFILDGIYLYLESYFWVISLFLIVQQSFWRLGVLVIFLTLFFGGVFYFIKNTIDRLPVEKVYTAAVFLYCLSWVLRGMLMTAEGVGSILLLMMLASITFSTSLFRLAFNKKFFDIAKSTTAHEYIFFKSYYSQFFIMLFFALMAVFFDVIPGEAGNWFSNVYYTAACFSIIYLLYIRRSA